VHNQEQTWDLPANSLGFTYCQTPVCYLLADAARIVVERPDGIREAVPANSLDAAMSASIFLRDGKVSRLTVFVPAADLQSEAGK
jgi:hypothetical protein